MCIETTVQEKLEKEMRANMKTYYNPEDLGKFSTMGEEASELWDAYMNYYSKVFEDGALTAREKSLWQLPCSAHIVLIPIREAA